MRAARLLVCLVLAGCAGDEPASGHAGHTIEGSTSYPRVVRLLDTHGAPDGTLLASSGARLFESDDHGGSWHRLGRIEPVQGRRMRCCETLFALPQPVGSLPAGTLLFAASYWVARVPAIVIFTSADQGQSWNYIGAPVHRGRVGHGLWEPCFAIAADGALVMAWSDETDPRHSQKLAQIRTRDGVHWQDEMDTVTSDVRADRPGMPTVSRSSDGRYLMTYEICGPTANCGVFSRMSRDGWNYGDPEWLGVKTETADGHTLHSAPSNAWSAAAGLPDGIFVLVAKKILQKDGSMSPLSGARLFVSTDPSATGFWSMIDAPVVVSDIAEKNACQNYSSALLPSPGGSTLLELAGSLGAGGGCTISARRDRLALPDGLLRIRPAA